MNGLHLLAFSAALSLTLTACTSGTVSPSPAGSPPPSESAPPDFDHLEFYDQFGRYNNSIDEHDFVISETEVDGKLQYQFQNEEHDVTVFVSPHGKNEISIATLAYQEKTLEFEMPIFILGYGNVSGVANFYLEDLTGDDMPELIYIYGAGGTGAWNDNVKVFDLSSMTEYPVFWTPEMLADGLTVFVGNSNSISLSDGQLTLTVLYTEEDSISADYAGSLSTSLAFAPDTSSFCPKLPCTVTVFDDNT